ncbi:kinetochore-associated protein NSL1 homolog isoform 2-T2 [Anomaloglossus baeobatrachus]|uniref:kinetochore-associated protein NSL1 homolog isoform X2 n=1 Tax=Anomaloglossus baeobatrachus TaxID=238106 RepID=UPI003F4F4013
MAANVDSPKRRSLRLQGASNENVIPDSRGSEGPRNDPRTPGPSNDPRTPGPSNDPRTPGPSIDPRTPGPSNDPRIPGPSIDPRTPGPSIDPRTPGPNNDPRIPGPSIDPRIPGRSIDPRTPGPSIDPRTPGPSNDPRISGPRTRLSDGKLNDSGSLRRSKGQKVEYPANESITGAKGKPSAGSTEVQTAGEDQGQSSDDKSHRKTVTTRRSGDAPPDDGRPARKDGQVKQERNDMGEVRRSPKSEEKGKKTVLKTEDFAQEVTASSSTRKMVKEEKAAPSIQSPRSDVEAAGPSGAASVAHSENAGPSRSNDDTKASVISPSIPPLCAAEGPDQGTSDAAPQRDSKVRCTSKKLLQEMLGMCSEFSNELLQSQNYLSPEQRQQEHRNFTLNFETVFQDNVSINGHSWDEASDTANETDIRNLEDQFDEAIVETTQRRKRYPEKIVRHFIKALKAEREILDHYKPVVEPKELRLDPNSESRMTEQTAMMASISQQIKETMKALPSHLEKAEGFSQVLSLQPVLQRSRLRQDIFSSRVVLQDLTKSLPKVLETSPPENEAAANIAPPRSTKRHPSSATQRDLYPLRSKRKISLEG